VDDLKKERENRKKEINKNMDDELNNRLQRMKEEVVNKFT